MSIAKPGRAAAIFGGILSVAIVAGAGALAWRGHLHSQENPLSDDASVEAEVVRIASGVPGRVKAVHVQENALVKAGDVLVELDDSAYRLALAQTRADLEIAEALASDRMRNIEAERANAEIAAEQVERARANLELATRTVERLKPMQAKGFVSVQQLDDALTVQRDAEVSLREALRQQEAAEALVGDDEGAAALIRARRAAMAVAEYELAQTKIRAPAEGRVAGLSVAEGDYVLPAQAMFSLIKTDVWHVSAGYTETELPRISEGDCATVYVLADRSPEDRRGRGRRGLGRELQGSRQPAHRAAHRAEVARLGAGPAEVPGAHPADRSPRRSHAGRRLGRVDRPS